MALHKIKDFDPDYRQHFDDTDMIGYDLYSGDEKVGTVENILVDDRGSFRYFVINTGVWILGKRTLLPIGRSRIEASDRRVYADGLSRAQIESLPEYDEHSTVDYDQEERTRDVYRPMSSVRDMGIAPTMGTTRSTETTQNMTGTRDTAAPNMTGTRDMAAPNLTGTRDMAAPLPNPLRPAADRDSYDYSHDASLYDLNDRDHQNLKLYEERLIANKTRQKTGEVTVGKHVETETAKVSVPIDKERVTIERTPGSSTAVDPSETMFQSGEVARMEVYEETPDIHKEAFVREEVTIRKDVDHETVEAQEQLRREELDINKEGRTIVDNGTDLHPDNRVK
jgi:uncharacterized protein (TIGR02271 family)